MFQCIIAEDKFTKGDEHVTPPQPQKPKQQPEKPTETKSESEPMEVDDDPKKQVILHWQMVAKYFLQLVIGGEGERQSCL